MVKFVPMNRRSNKKRQRCPWCCYECSWRSVMWNLIYSNNKYRLIIYNINIWKKNL